MRARSLKVSGTVRDLLRHLHPDPKRKVRAALNDILDDPACGKPLERELEGYRSLPIGRYRIIYPYTPDEQSGVSFWTEGLVGRTNIVLDERLVKRVMQLSGAKTKRQAVDQALREMVARGSVYRALRKLRGKLPWEGDLRAWRRGRR